MIPALRGQAGRSIKFEASLCLPSAGIKGASHHAGPDLIFLILKIMGFFM